MKHLTSTNLITDLKFKQKVGVKADSAEEALAIINEHNSDVIVEKIDPEVRNDLQINAKLFIRTFNEDKALEAVQCLKEVLGSHKCHFNDRLIGIRVFLQELTRSTR